MVDTRSKLTLLGAAYWALKEAFVIRISGIDLGAAASSNVGKRTVAYSLSWRHL